RVSAVGQAKPRLPATPQAATNRHNQKARRARHNNKQNIVVEDENILKYLLGYLKRPQWQGKTWDEIKNQATLPIEANDLNAFFAAEQQRRIEIQTLLDEVAQLDAEIDEKVLDLYGITEPGDRQRILGSAAISDEDVDMTDEESEETE
ncbi:MAG: hypothetical protein LH647_20170, partial [Leptolyngbyaceae cyanobacterium CAN_BIN12]|nr:hypothetical protein [Leptolyngbyaceae cyanobacterium CAN_BIN12]